MRFTKNDLTLLAQVIRTLDTYRAKLDARGGVRLNLSVKLTHQGVALDELVKRIKFDATRTQWLTAVRALICGATYKEAGRQIGVSEARCKEIKKIVVDAMMSAKYPGPRYERGWALNLRGARKMRKYHLTNLDELAKVWGAQTLLSPDRRNVKWGK